MNFNLLWYYFAICVKARWAICLLQTVIKKLTFFKEFAFGNKKIVIFAFGLISYVILT